MAKKLVKNVAVDGVWYGPDHGNADQVPADVAERITSDVWEDVKPAARKSAKN